MKIGAIAPWLGGKRTMASQIVAELGKHNSFFDPMCGGLPVLLAKEPSKLETVNDLHGDLVNLARVLQNAEMAVDLYERLQRTLFCEEDFRMTASRLSTAGPYDASLGPNVDRAWEYFISAWAGRNGIAGTRERNFSLCVRWTPTGGSPTVRFRSAIDSIPAWHERLRNVVILNRDAFDIINSIADRSDAAIYCDPPYLLDTRGKGSGSRYLFDFAETSERDDHATLSEKLAFFTNARVVVSYYAHPRLLDLYPPSRWTHIDCTRTKNLSVATRGSDATSAPEVLIVNGPSLSA